MDKNNLIRKISAQTGFKKKKCENIFNFIIASVSKELGNRNEVIIEGFGEFKIYREKIRIKVLKNEMKAVSPPKDILNFIPSENLLK